MAEIARGFTPSYHLLKNLGNELSQWFSGEFFSYPRKSLRERDATEVDDLVVPASTQAETLFVQLCRKLDR
jgi:hypothetical protein